MNKKTLGAIIGAVAIVIAAIIGYLAAIKPVEKIIEATQTAEGKLSTEAQLPTSTIVPTPLVVVDTSSLVGWVPNFDFSNRDSTLNEVNTTGSGIEITYDVGDDGYVVITKEVDQGILSDSEGISFRYKGRGAPNTIEFKLMLRYPGDSNDTTYGKLWNRATDTNNKWIDMKVLYIDMSCWWPTKNCEIHGDLLDTKMVDRLDFVVVNKPGDDEGSGWVLFTDVFGIQP